MSSKSLPIIQQKQNVDPARSASSGSGSKSTFQFKDLRSVTVLQRHIQDLASNHALAQECAKPALQLKAGIPVNDDKGLEKEADLMGAMALQPKAQEATTQRMVSPSKKGTYASSQQGGAVLAAILQRMPKKYKKDSDSEEEEYKPPGADKQKRFSIPDKTTRRVIRKTAHKRKNYNKKRFKAVYTCPACSRPMAYKGIKDGMKFTKYAYTSKVNKNKHSLRALTMDHHPPWAPRLSRLEKSKASDDKMKLDYQDPTRLRAICKKCNESHKHEGKNISDYESDTDDEGFIPPTDEPENKNLYDNFRFDPPGKGGGGLTA